MFEIKTELKQGNKIIKVFTDSTTKGNEMITS